MFFQNKVVRYLRAAEQHIPIDFRSHPQFMNYAEFLKQQEYDLALDSLVELYNETEAHFPKDFWQSLLLASEKMGLDILSEYISKQLYNQ